MSFAEGMAFASLAILLTFAFLRWEDKRQDAKDPWDFEPDDSEEIFMGEPAFDSGPWEKIEEDPTVLHEDLTARDWDGWDQPNFEHVKSAIEAANQGFRFDKIHWRMPDDE